MKISLYLTNQCNVDRGICYDILRCHPLKSDSIFDRANGYLDSARLGGFDEVAFSGGEVTLQMDKLLPLIKYAKSLGFATQLKTNGWWANKNKDYPQQMLDAGLDSLRISYDSARFYIGSPLAQSVVLEAIDIGKRVFTNIVIVPHEGEPDLPILRKIEDLGNTIVEIQPRLGEGLRIASHIITGFDSSLGKIVTETIPYKGSRFIIDFKGRVFNSSEGIANAEILGTLLVDRYIGDLNKGKFKDLLIKYNKMIK